MSNYCEKVFDWFVEHPEKILEVALLSGTILIGWEIKEFKKLEVW